MIKKRKLRKGEHRIKYRSGLKAIYKPKKFNEWKENKLYNRSEKIWEFIDAVTENKIFFINFEISNSNGYVQGSLSSSIKIKLEDGKKLIKANLPANYEKPINFIEAEEKGFQKETLLVVLRKDNPDDNFDDGEEIFQQVLNV